MARTTGKLTDTGIKASALKSGRHSDGGGLYLNVAAAGSKSWVFMWSVGGKRREMGMGAYPEIGLAKARKMAAEYREAVADGRDPIAERAEAQAASSEPNFGECCDQLIASMSSSWRNEKHRAQWKMTLEVYAKPIREKRVSTIDTNDVLKVLNPIWTKKAETASRLRGRIENVLDFAKAKGWRTGENPALWRGHLKNVLPARQKLTRGHHAAMPYDQVPAFMAELRKSEGLSARMLELTILTAARSGEAREAVWAEFDLEKAIWTIPAKRMKAAKEHRVPLSGRVLELLRELYGVRTGSLVFPSMHRDKGPAGKAAEKPLSVMAMDMLLRRLKQDVTVHGFRSAFRDWAGEETSFPREVAEQALAHHVGDAVERAYRRGDALEKRRQLMEAWSAYLAPSEPDQTGMLPRLAPGRKHNV